MKCVKKGNDIQRVKDVKAEQMTQKEGWKYCPKTEWKALKQKEVQNGLG